MRRTILTLTLPALLVAGPAVAGGFDVRIGGFVPRAKECGVPPTERAEYTLFMDVCKLYVPESRGLDELDWKSDLRGVYGGVEYNSTLAPYLELGVHVDAYGKSVDTRYRDYERESGSDIFQTVKFGVVPVGVTLRLVPTRRYTRFAPYVGAGVDAVFYTWEEDGDLITNFNTGDIESSRLRDRGVALGLHAVGGMRFYFTDDLALVAEGRYLWAKKDMGDDFVPNESLLVNRIDLSGGSVTVGLHVRF